jgi:RIO-like serine/threonine protein kinase
VQAPLVLKRDALGRVERIEHAGRPYARRVACGGRLPLSRWVARRLLARERAALRRLDGLEGVPRVVDDPALRGPGDPRDVLVRSWIEGEALPGAAALPADFFDRLDELVAAVHARGVCHNDLHKEPNVVVGRDGYPWLVDFQLASVHRGAGALFRSRCREDLRHVEKHRRRYTRLGRGPGGEELRGAGRGLPRSWLARVWRRLGKPLYLLVTRGPWGGRDGAEQRRPSSGPWPAWTPPVGPRAAADQRMSSR